MDIITPKITAISIDIFICFFFILKLYFYPKRKENFLANNFLGAAFFLLIFFILYFFKFPDLFLSYDSNLLIVPTSLSYLSFFIATSFILNIFFKLIYGEYSKIGLYLGLFLALIVFIIVLLFSLGPALDNSLGLYYWKFPLFVYILIYGIVILTFIPTAIIFLLRAKDQEGYRIRYLLVSICFGLWGLGMVFQARPKFYFISDPLIILGFLVCLIGVLYHPRTEKTKESS